MKNIQTAHCNDCNKMVSFHYPPVNHWKHFFITLITLGMWLPMWLILRFSPTKVCDECGGPIWDTK